MSGAITLPSSIISMEQTRLDTYHEILDEQGISNPNLFEYFFYNDIADWKFLGNTAASSVKGICNEFDEKIINGTTEDRAEAGGKIFFNAICAAFAAEYLSNKSKNKSCVSVCNKTSNIKSSELIFGSDTKSTRKLMSQINNRGWTENLIKDTVDNPYTVRNSLNKATGNSATVFYTQQGSYVIVDDVTKSIVQVSDNINPSTWVPDSSIINPYTLN